MVLRTALFFAVLAYAQPPPPMSVEVEGTVVDGGGAFVEGATVQLRSPFVFPDGIAENFRDVVTEAYGRFHFEGNAAGRYAVTASKKGYIQGKTEFLVAAGDTRREMRITIQRGPTITGRVEDADTHEPVRGLPLSIQEIVSWQTGPNATTQSDGRFTYEGWTAGPNRLRVVPRLWARERVQTKFTEDDIAAVDQDYEESYWPGGSDLKSVVPMLAIPGATVDMGTIRLRKTAYYRAHVAFPAKGCEAGTQYQVKVAREVPGRKIPDGEMEFNAMCGQDLLLLGLLPGSYLATFQPKNVPADKEQWAFVPFAITDRNAKVTAEVRMGEDLELHVMAVQGELPAGSEVQIGFGESQRLDARGRVTLRNVPLSQWRVGFDLPKGWILREVRHKGVPQRLMISFVNLKWDGAGSLEAIVDNRPASVRGTVTDLGKPAAGAVAMIAPWPPPQGGYTSTVDFEQKSTDANGAFQFEGLAEGEYRLFAIPPEVAGRFGLGPEAVDQLAPQGEKAVVPRGGSVSVDLKLITK